MPLTDYEITMITAALVVGTLYAFFIRMYVTNDEQSLLEALTEPFAIIISAGLLGYMAALATV